ncbi:MAG TPA: hypothetical protein VJJ51_13890 [Candidatus Methanoperedens sp.]|nr:hypothetical protein [Candidatus Methanoperedens sp.]HLB72128.1 hypothetical protein [Candidatus Methanoperedens sp.]
MYKFTLRVNEIRKVQTRFRVIETVLDSVIILLVAFLVLPLRWIFIPSLVYIIIQLRYGFRYNIIKMIEQRYPSLKERLSTVHDHRDEKNVVVEDLAASVLADMEQVRYSSFISTKRLGIRIAAILLLVTLVLSTSIISPYLIRQTEISIPSITYTDALERIGQGPDTDIFNESSYVRIGNETQGIVLYRGSISELNVQGEKRKAPEIPASFPGQPSAIPSEIYTGSVPAVYQEIVKNYFTNLSGEE